MSRGEARTRLLAAAAVAAGVLLAAAATAPADPPLRGAAGEQWVQRALNLQDELGHDVELRNASWLGTHNSFNSIAEMGPTLSVQDSNQRITIVEQLDAGMRAIELDLHWILDPQSGGFVVMVCHGTDEDVGCTTEKTLDVVLDEIAAWLRQPANRREVLQLYLEDDLFARHEQPTEEAYAEAARIVQEKLGDLVYPTEATECKQIPLDLTRAEQLRSGHRVLVLANGCGIGPAWHSLVHNWREDPETGKAVQQERQPVDYAEFPECDPEDQPPNPDAESWDPKTYKRLFIRYYETSTRLEQSTGAARDPITPQTAARMARCGVDLIHFDQLTGPDDKRLRRVVWSWAPGEPDRGRCVIQRVTAKEPWGRWHSQRCALRRPAACRTGDWKWTLSEERVSQRAATAPCRDEDGEFAAPRSGYEAQLLRRAMEKAGVRSVWLGYQKRRGEWAALDSR